MFRKGEIVRLGCREKFIHDCLKKIISGSKLSCLFFSCSILTLTIVIYNHMHYITHICRYVIHNWDLSTFCIIVQFQVAFKTSNSLLFVVLIKRGLLNSFFKDCTIFCCPQRMTFPSKIRKTFFNVVALSNQHTMEA